MASLPYQSPDATSSPAETLRRAAALMRERAEAATGGPWHASWAGGVRLPSGKSLASAHNANDANAEHIASWHPSVALAVADWLDAEVRIAEKTGVFLAFDALDVARAYLGGVA